MKRWLFHPIKTYRLWRLRRAMQRIHDAGMRMAHALDVLREAARGAM